MTLREILNDISGDGHISDLLDKEVLVKTTFERGSYTTWMIASVKENSNEIVLVGEES